MEMPSAPQIGQLGTFDEFDGCQKEIDRPNWYNWTKYSRERVYRVDENEARNAAG